MHRTGEHFAHRLRTAAGPPRPEEESTKPWGSSCPAQWVRQSQYMFVSPPRASGIHKFARQKPSDLRSCPMAAEPYIQPTVQSAVIHAHDRHGVRAHGALVYRGRISACICTKSIWDG